MLWLKLTLSLNVLYVRQVDYSNNNSINLGKDTYKIAKCVQSKITLINYVPF